ncbi:hypothetical protein LTR17_018674 [Elasticomyces elasticus]|nr:hypothetical protein LTR17_018674 [Elasticomyces elasticus]
MLRRTIPALLWIALTSTSLAQNETQTPTLPLSADDTFSFDLLNSLGLALYSGGDIAPILGVAQTIEPGNFTSFSQNLYALANQTKAAAIEAECQSDAINARDTWFAAATYFRKADAYLHGNWNDPLIEILWNEQLYAFDKAIASLPVAGRRVQLPSNDNFTVEAIWYAASSDSIGCRRPTMIIGNGYEGSQEDMYHTIVVPALACGWNCITYEGPGQPTVRRRQNLGFIPEWERVVTPVVDYVLQEPSVDPARIVLFGYSFGGFLAARAAAFEPRISAVLLDGGIFDTFDSFSSNLPPIALSMFNAGNKTAFDTLLDSVSNDPDIPTTLRWGIQQGLWSFNTQSAYDFLQMTKLYTLRNISHQISAPVWTADAESEGFFVNQSMKVKEALGDQATYHLFSGPAGYHCQVGAAQELNRVIFTWLKQTIG